MTKKEEFLNLKTYEEFDKRRFDFVGLDINDPEIKDHFNSLFPTLDNSDFRKGIIVELKKNKD